MGNALDRFVAKDPRLGTRDTNLPEGALVLIHHMGSRPIHPEYNYKLLVFEDGRVLKAANSGKNRQIIVDGDFPAKPDKKLGKAFADSIKQALRDEKFLDLTENQRNPMVEDGWMKIMRARVDGRENEILYINARSQVFALLGLL